MRCVNSNTNFNLKMIQTLVLFLLVLFLFKATDINYQDEGIVCQDENIVSYDIIEIKNIMDTEKELGMCGTSPVIVCPYDVMVQYESIDDGSVIFSVCDVYSQIRENEEDESSLSQEQKDKYLLSTICEDSAQPDILQVKTAICREQIEYMIVYAGSGIEGYMESLDFELVGQSQSYLIYRYKYPWYTEITDGTEVMSRKEIMGVHENEVVIELGLQKEYTILTLNDLHMEAMDITVMEPYRQIVHERYAGFCSGTGVKNIDMWNGLSSIIDSYQADGVCFLGDMIDYNSDTTVDLLGIGMEEISAPCMYLRADHDLGIWYTDGMLTIEDAIANSSNVAPWSDIYVQDYEEFFIVGWNNSTSQLTEVGLQQAKEIFEQAKELNKPIILLTHVPINSLIDVGLETQARQYDSQGRAKLWGRDCLYQPDQVTEEFLEMLVADDTPVRAVFAGHLHFPYAVNIRENVPEYVMEPAFYGGIGVIRLK